MFPRSYLLPKIVLDVVAPAAKIAELHHAESCLSCRNRIFGLLRSLGSTAGSRQHINGSRKLRSRCEKNAVRHSQPYADLTVGKAHDERFLVESHVVSIVPM